MFSYKFKKKFIKSCDTITLKGLYSPRKSLPLNINIGLYTYIGVHLSQLPDPLVSPRIPIYLLIDIYIYWLPVIFIIHRSRPFTPQIPIIPTYPGLSLYVFFYIYRHRFIALQIFTVTVMPAYVVFLCILTHSPLQVFYLCKGTHTQDPQFLLIEISYCPFV